MKYELEYTQQYHDVLHRCGTLEIGRRTAYQRGMDLLFIDLQRAESEFAEASRIDLAIVDAYGDLVRLHCEGKALTEHQV